MKISIKTYCTNTLLFILLMWFSLSHAEPMQLRVNIAASQLHESTKALQLKCEIKSDQDVIPLQTIIKANNAQVHQSVDIPFTLENNLSHYNTIHCSLYMCTNASSTRSCQQPLSNAISFSESDAYRVFNAEQPRRLSARQQFTMASLASQDSSTSTESIGISPISADIDSSDSNTQSEPETLTGTVSTFNAGTLHGKGVVIKPVTINAGTLFGTGVSAPRPTVTISVNKKENGVLSSKSHVMITRVNHITGAPYPSTTVPEPLVLNCREGCTNQASTEVPSSSWVEMRLLLDRHYQFDGWSGDSECPSTAVHSMIQLNHDIQCTANFSVKPITGYTLSLGKSGRGRGFASIHVYDPGISFNDVARFIHNHGFGSAHSRFRPLSILCDSNCNHLRLNSVAIDRTTYAHTSTSRDGLPLTEERLVEFHVRPDSESDFAGFAGDCGDARITGNSAWLTTSRDRFCLIQFNKESKQNDGEINIRQLRQESKVDINLERSLNVPENINVPSNINPTGQFNQ